MTAEKLARINQILDELDEAATEACENGEEIQLTVLLSPINTKD